MNIIYREMMVSDYDDVKELWDHIEGFAIRSIDDSRKGIERFIGRNPGLCVVAIDADNDRLVGTILCGHDGRTATFYHVCVHKDYRRHGVGHHMVNWCMEALRRDEINQITLIAYADNTAGNGFWHGIGWNETGGLNRYDYKLNEENRIRRKI